jgi:hypothetical protein
MPSAAGSVPPVPLGSIRVSARQGLDLRAGDIVTLHVIKRLTGDKWAVGLGGRVLPARTDLDLSPGAVLRARVQSASGRVLFVLERGTASPLADALLRAGVPDNPESRLIAAALVRGGRPVDPDTVDKVRALLVKTRREARRGARAAATMLDKGIDPASPGAADLLDLISLDEPGGRDPDRHHGRRFPRDPGEVKTDLSEAAGPDAPTSGLHVYNALRGRSETWMVVPFVYRDGDVECPGAVKLLVDPYAGRLRRLVVGIRPSGSGTWHFSFDVEGRRRMSVYADEMPIRGAARANLDILIAKVHNMGIEVSDTVRDGREFDGFSSADAEVVPAAVDATG